jgi:UDP-2,3-diacylglucosamine hydrolase
MGTIFFVSDIHLGFDKKSKESTREKLFLDFLRYVEKKATSLIIVGDLFDFWFEYVSVIPRQYFNILSALKKVIDIGIEVRYIAGNHDFWMSNFFQDDLGIQVYHKNIDIEIDKKRFHISHGDGLAKHDRGYRILKNFLRLPLLIHLYRILHPDIGFALANLFSRWSRNHTANKNKDDEYIQYAILRFSEGFDFVILGHTHSALEYKKNDHVYINTGDWIESFTYCEYKNGKLSLKQWPVINDK